MENEVTTNTAEKQRLRDSISEQVRRFVESGGRITVIDKNASSPNNYRGVTWPGGTDTGLGLD